MLSIKLFLPTIFVKTVIFAREFRGHIEPSTVLKFVIKIGLVLAMTLSAQTAFSQVASTLTKEAQEIDSTDPLNELELGQPFKYSLQWNCSLISVVNGIDSCGSFTLTDPLPDGFVFESCLVSDNLYTCSHDALTNTVTITLTPPNVLADGDASNATIIGSVSNDFDFSTDGLENTAEADVENIAVNPTATSDLPVNPPENNWVIEKTVAVPSGTLGPALDNDVIYKIEICPDGPAGVGTGTIPLTNPTITDACPIGAAIAGADFGLDSSLSRTALPVTGVCDNISFDFAAAGITEFDPIDGCHDIQLTVQYPDEDLITGADFEIGDDVTNTATLSSDEILIDPDSCPNECMSSVTSTIQEEVPDAETGKSAKRSTVGQDARNQYSIVFDTTNTNIAQTNVVLEDVFPTEITPLSLTIPGWSNQNVVADITSLDGLTVFETGFDGSSSASIPVATGPEPGFRIVFTSPVPAGFIADAMTLAFQVNADQVVGDSFENCITVNSDQLASELESCSTVTIVEDSTDISLSKNMPPAVTPDTPFTTTFSFIQDNTSTTGAENPIITDCIGKELDFISFDNTIYTGLDDPGTTNTANSQPVAVAPTFTTLVDGDVGFDCDDPAETKLIWEWTAFTFPVRPDNNANNIGDSTGPLGYTSGVEFEVTLSVKEGVLVQNNLENTVEFGVDSPGLRCLTGGPNAAGNCEDTVEYNILSAAALSGAKFVSGFPGLPNYDPGTPPASNDLVDLEAVSDAGCPAGIDDPDPTDTTTRAPCVAQVVNGQPFNYAITLNNDGNVPLTDYVVYDVLPNTDTSGSDTGTSEALSGFSRDSSWAPLLTGPILLSSNNMIIDDELAANAIVEYSASSDACRPELSIANDASGADWQTACIDDWTATPLLDPTTFPNGFGSVKAWRIYVPFENPEGWPVGNNPFAPEDVAIRVDFSMVTPPNAPPSDYEAMPPVLEVAWNNIAHRATNASDDSRLLATEIIKTGVVAPPADAVVSTGYRIGNLVWVDTNNNGLAEDGEQGIVDVTVQLWLDADDDGVASAGDTLYDTTQTDSFGHYLFDDADIFADDNLGIPEGNYYVVIPEAQTGPFVLSENYSSIIDEADADDNGDNNDNGAFDTNGTAITTTDPNSPDIDGIYSSVVNLGEDGADEPVDESLRSNDTTDDDDDFFTDTDSNVSVDFGFYQLRLGNFIWLDNGAGASTNNGVADSGEAAIPGLDVQLWLDSDGNTFFDPMTDTLVATDTTNPMGQYQFDHLPAGNYFVAIPNYTSVTAGGTTYGPNQLISSSPAAGTLAVDNEDDGTTPYASDAAFGSYVSVSPLYELVPGMADTFESDGSNNGINGSSSTDPLDPNVELSLNLLEFYFLPDENSFQTADFSFVPTVSLGSTVWVDTNANGVQDAGEGGISGATVTLLDMSGDPIDSDPSTLAIEPITSTTNSDGEYNFNNLPPGTYRVSVDLGTTGIVNINNYLPTPSQNAAPNDNNQLDSNIEYAVDPDNTDLIHISGPIDLLAGTEPAGEQDPINAAQASQGDQPNQTDLIDNAGNMTLDIGFVPPVSLGSTLWVDDNENGLYDAGETPIHNATVTLLFDYGLGYVDYDSDPYTAGPQILEVMTDTLGQYSFNGLPPGDYRVEVDLSSVNITSNPNAGLLIPTPSQIADPDAPGDGQDTNNDSNIDAVFDTNTTDQIHTSGVITLLPGLEPIEEALPGGAIDTDQPDQGLMEDDDPDLNGNMTVDFGFIEPVSLGSTVWFDTNGDGIQGAGELPIVGAKVTLLNADNTIYDSNPATTAIDSLVVSTDPQGQYNFNGLPEGEYRVLVDLNDVTSHDGPSLVPSTMQVAEPDAVVLGDDDNTDSNIDVSVVSAANPSGDISLTDAFYTSGAISLTIGDEPLLETDPIGAPLQDQPNQTATEPDANGNMTVDMGFFAPVSLGSTLWEDTNADGVQDSGEPAIEGATVTLLNADGTEYDDPYITGTQSVTTTTNSDGEYNFNGLVPGDYRILVDLSSVAGGEDYIPTPAQEPDPEDDDNTDSNIDLSVPGTTVGTNANDTASDDHYTSGVITLVAADEPEDEEDPINAAGNGTAADSDQPMQGLVAGDDPDNSGNMTLDMGFIRPVSLGSTVWVDMDGDGFQSAGEAPVVGASVILLNADGTTFDSNPNNAVADPLTATTDVDGQYHFNDLPEGDYRVLVDLTGSSNTGVLTFIPTPSQIFNPNDDDNTDSNIDLTVPTTTVGTNANDTAFDSRYTSGVVSLSIGDEPQNETDLIIVSGTADDQPNQMRTDAEQPDANGNMTVDFGFIEPVSVGSVVWFDSNVNGVQDDDEFPIEGAIVTLLDEFGDVYDSDPNTPLDQALTVTTGPTGEYNFNGLPAGNYIVQVDMSDVTGAISILPTVPQVPNANTDTAMMNADSNIATILDPMMTPLVTADDLYLSGIVELTVGGEPTGEQDVIDANTTGGLVDDQPNQTALQLDLNGNMTIDFGFFQPVSLGSTVWEDLNGNGLQDSGEPGIEGAEVTLLGPDGAGGFIPVPGFTTTTDSDGQYNFNGLPPGDYQVQVDLSDVVGGADLFPSPVQVADPDDPMDPLTNDNNEDSNIDLDSDTDTTDQVHTSGTITLLPGSEPEDEEDDIGTPGDDQPNQDSTLGVDPGNSTNPDASGNMTVDFGFVRPVSLGSTIWQDSNADGIQDDGEPGLLNATVTLIDAATGLPVSGVTSVTTNANGEYFFNDLPPGDYRVQVDLSTVAGGGTLIPSPVQVADPDPINPADPTMSINDNTDSNVDLAADPTPGDLVHLSGVITLRAGGEPENEADPIDGVDGTTGVTDQPGQTTANPDNSGNMTLDLAFYSPVSIGSFVWEDLNANGMQDANEPPLAGSIVTLFVSDSAGGFTEVMMDLSGNAISPITVGPDGLYDFSNLAPGTYKVQVEPPAGFFPSPVQSVMNDDDTPDDSNIASETSTGIFESAEFTVTSGGEPNEVGPDTNPGDNQDGVAGGPEDTSGNMTIDFGFVPPASIGNYVWLDLNEDGVQDSNEDAIAGVTVNLYVDTDDDGIPDMLVDTVVTGPNGEYLFPGLQPGVAYHTMVDSTSLPSSYTQTYDEGVDGLNHTSDPIILDPNEYHDTADFGYVPTTGTIGDTIWIDADMDGIQDPGEIGVPGVTVTLTDTNGNTYTTMTDASGKYLFTDLPLNVIYQVTVSDGPGTPLEDYTNHPLGDPDVRDGNSTDPDSVTYITLTDDDPVNLDADFGYSPPDDQNNSIGDTVWMDVDQDGNGPPGAGPLGNDTNEVGIAGVIVTLLDSTGNPIASMPTDANGMYLFTGLPDGDYTVVVTDENNVLVGMNQTYDSDDPANPGSFIPTTQNESSVTGLGLLPDGTNDPMADLNDEQDFGYVDSNTAGGDGSIGDTIFFDSDNSGSPDAGEGLEGVVVELYGAGPDGVFGTADDVLLDTTTTDVNGNYLFTGLDTSDTAGEGSGTPYQVIVDTMTLPNGGAGWTNSVDPDITVDGDSVSITTLTNDDPIDLDQDFGYIGGDNIIRGTVWPDTDGNGEQEETGGFAGVKIILKDENGQIIATTFTDMNGDYAFTGLPDGIYSVEVDDVNNVLAGFEHTDSPGGSQDPSDEASKDDTGYIIELGIGIDEQDINVTGDFGYMPIITNPISLGSFSAMTIAGGVQIDWATQTEVSNLGFNVYALIDEEWITLNDSLIVSQGDSVSIQDYSVIVAVEANVFALGDVDLAGLETVHGPFMLDQTYGEIGERQTIDWESERAEREAKEADRDAQRQQQQRERNQRLRQLLQGQSTSYLNQPGSNEDSDMQVSQRSNWIQRTAALVLAAVLPSAHAQGSLEMDLINFETTQSGIHQVSYEDLLDQAAPLDLSGVPVDQLALINQGVPVQIQVIGSSTDASVFGTNAAIRFVADQVDTLYSDTNVYTLRLVETGSEDVQRVNVENTPIPSGASATAYLAKARFAPQSKYSFASPETGDPWYATHIQAVGQEASESVQLNLDNVAPGGNSGSTKAKLTVNLWGASSLAGAGDDHSVKVRFNNSEVVSDSFDGLVEREMNATLDQVNAGNNTVEVVLPMDTGYAYDAVNVDEIEVSYPRQFVAIDDRLDFTSTFSKFQLSGFANDDLVVMRDDINGLFLETNVNAACRGTCSVQFAGTGQLADYYVSSVDALPRPILAELPVEKDITSNDAQYLIISHPDFINAASLQALKLDLSAEFGSAEIIDVEAIYAQFGHHVFDPAAIQAYIQDSVANRGTEYVLLIGGDVYDYRQFENEDAMSFIPSIYASTGNQINFAPVDAKYVDLDDDNVPDLPIGRLPVRTVAQLDSLLSKRTDYVTRSYNGKILLVADEYDDSQQYDFSEDADEIDADFLSNFDTTKVYVDEYLDNGQSVAQARSELVSAINEGQSMTAFFGHSSTNQWAFNGLFTGNDAAGLANYGKPTVVTQWGCWNAYYVSPNEDSMGHRFMMEGDQGAVAVMGATTLTNANSERKLARLVLERIANGERLGDAITNAKQAYALDNPNDLDVLLGWTLLGLPDLMVN